MLRGEFRRHCRCGGQALTCLPQGADFEDYCFCVGRNGNNGRGRGRRLALEAGPARARERLPASGASSRMIPSSGTRSLSVIRPRDIKNCDPPCPQSNGSRTPPEYRSSFDSGNSRGGVKLLCFEHPLLGYACRRQCHCGDGALTCMSDGPDCLDYCFCDEHSGRSSEEGATEEGRGPRTAMEVGSARASGRVPASLGRIASRSLPLDPAPATPQLRQPPRVPFEDSPLARSRLSRGGDMVLMCTGHPVRERQCLDRCSCETATRLTCPPDLLDCLQFCQCYASNQEPRAPGFSEHQMRWLVRGEVEALSRSREMQPQSGQGIDFSGGASSPTRSLSVIHPRAAEGEDQGSPPVTPTLGRLPQITGPNPFEDRPHPHGNRVSRLPRGLELCCENTTVFGRMCRNNVSCDRNAMLLFPTDLMSCRLHCICHRGRPREFGVRYAEAS